MDISYNFWLVILSLALSVIASFAALSIAARIPYVDRKNLWIWIGGGSISMGLAIWSMHFVGMLAFHIDTPLAYDIPLTGLSIVYAIAATAVALLIVRSGYRNLFSLIIATFFMGSGIAAMHYTGMDALKMMPPIVYDQTLFVLSLIIAYAASFVALHLFFFEADETVSAHNFYHKKRVYAACLMGIAIAGMHYTAMEAAIFSKDTICGAVGSGINPGIISIMIVMGVILIISITLLMLMLDTKYTDNERLRQSEKQVRQVIDSAPQGMLVTNRNGEIVQVNNSISQISGYSATELIGQQIEILIPEQIRKMHVSLRKEYLNNPERRSMNKLRSLSLKHKDGSQVPVEVGLSPILNNQDTMVLATILDITERQALEQRLESKRKDLAEANQRIMLATDSAEIGIWEYNLIDGTLIWDEWMLRIYGIASDQFPGTYAAWEKFVISEDLEIMKHEINQAILGKKHLDARFRIAKPDGKICWIKANGSRIIDNDGLAVRLIGINQDVTDKIQNEEVIWKQANYDSLTRLPNRKLFHEILTQEIKQAHRYRQRRWALFLDLDSFKEVNDTLGHDAGDILLVKVAERIRECIREADFVARLGGDEFAVLTKVPDVTSIDTIAAKLIEVISRSYQINDEVVYISTSIGIASYPEDAMNSGDLLKFADQSMYAAKKSGKNRYSYFTAELQEASLRRVQVSKDIHRALANNEFQLFYQPIFDLSLNQVHKAEALIRWVDPDRGMVSPDSFIPIAEETGLICDIGSWVFENAFQQLVEWKSKLHPQFQLSINMSPFQLKVPDDKYGNWLDKLEEYALPGKCIVIEITEGLLLKSNEMVTDRLLQYRDADVQVAIDDFGTGYSSLAYLKDFDIDYLKIDQSFTRHLTHDSRELSLSEAIVVMAHKLGLKVIAEGIETEQQRELLKAMGCDYGQGYLFSRPVPANEFEKILC